MSAKALLSVVACCWAVLPLTAAQAVVPEGNLVVNPGAEDGPAGSDTETVVPPGWTTTATFTVIAYGTPLSPTLADSAALGGGANFFAGGTDSAVATATQTVDISAAAAEIDAGSVGATLSALLGGFASQNDGVTVRAIYRNAAAAALGATTIGPVTAAERGGTTGLQPRSTVARVPAGTRAIDVIITATRSAGTYNDGYSDNISLTLGRAPDTGIGGPTADPPVRGESVQVRELRGAVTVMLPPGTAASALRGGLAFGQIAQAGFVPLSQVANVPVRSIVNATRGTIRLTAAQGAGSDRRQSGDFSRGTFQMRQAPRGDTTMELRMTGVDFRAACGRARAEPGAESAQRRVVQRVRGNARGRFRTRGRYSAATVRGTDWTVTDRCDGTLTSVRRGSVRVRDLARRRTVTVRAGGSYFARPR